MYCIRDKRPEERGRLAVLSHLANVPLIYSFRRFSIIKVGALFLKTNCLSVRPLHRFIHAVDAGGERTPTGALYSRGLRMGQKLGQTEMTNRVNMSLSFSIS